ncbi:MAG TPA: serine hydrolase domain-containing protein [Steroidobacteraceae bacterium]|nr:serine hydrolase domain-containing protein [Steroidobacteraceae bacterium]
MTRNDRVVLNVVLAVGCIALLNGCGGGDGGGTPPTQPPASPSPPTGSCAQIPAPSAPGTLGAIVDAAMIAEMAASGTPGMTVMLAKNGAVIYSQAYGYANLSSCTRVQTATEFQIGSITKQFTAAAILQLHNTGALNIDNTVVSYLPSYTFDSRITVRMLLTQTSGLVDYLDFPQAPTWIPGVTQQTVITAITQAPLRFTPGAAFEYSNSNYFILGSIIESVSGQTYAAYLAAHILQPLGLAHTGLVQPLSSASPYTTNLAPGIIPDPSGFFAAGALWSNVQDVTTWNVGLASGAVIPTSLLPTMLTPPAVPEFGAPNISSEYAMGWVRSSHLGRPWVWHNGQTLAYTSFNGVFLDNGLSLSILANRDIQENAPGLSLPKKILQQVCSSSFASSC